MSSSSVHVSVVQQSQEQALEKHSSMKHSASQRSYCSTSSSGSSSSNNTVVEEKKRENPAACIFVASLNKSLDDGELQESVFVHFSKWGNILGVKVFKDWLKRPYAFVQYESVADSKTALKEAPGTILNGRSVRCEPARVNRSICLVSLSQPFNKQYLQDALAEFGEIEDVSILQPQGKFHSVFIKFKYRDDAIKAFLTLKYADRNTLQLVTAANTEQQWFVEWASNLDVNNLYSIGTGVVASRYGPAYYRLDKCSIFVGNLPESITEEALRTKFEHYGTIKRLYIIRKPSYGHRGPQAYHDKNNQNNLKNDSKPASDEALSNSGRVFAFIKYSHQQHAINAIDRENGSLLRERILRVCYRQFCVRSDRYHQQKQQQQLNNDRASDMFPWYTMQTSPTAFPSVSSIPDRNPMPFMAGAYYHAGVSYYGIPEQQSPGEKEASYPTPYMLYPWVGNRGFYQPYIMATNSTVTMPGRDRYNGGYNSIPMPSTPLCHKVIPVSLPTSSTEYVHDHHLFQPIMECAPNSMPPPYTTTSTANNGGKNSYDTDPYYTSSSAHSPITSATNDLHSYQGFNSAFTTVPAAAVVPYGNNSSNNCHRDGSNAVASESYPEIHHPAVIYYAYSPPLSSASAYHPQPQPPTCTHTEYSKKKPDSNSYVDHQPQDRSGTDKTTQLSSESGITATNTTTADSSSTTETAAGVATSGASDNPTHLENERND